MYRKLCFGFVAVLLATLLPGCSTVESRIKSNPQLYASLSPADQALVRQGQIRVGMSKGAVFLAWGNPDRIGSSRYSLKANEQTRESSR
jgi:outer membrane protein assembly factor BamE (lipoprotein component of BamABCDE complex)